MNIFFLGFIGMWETVFLLVIVLVLFGARRLPELAKGLGQGIKEFKKATHGVEEELQKAFDVDDNPPRPPKQVPPQQSKSHSENAASTASSKSDH